MRTGARAIVGGLALALLAAGVWLALRTGSVAPIAPAAAPEPSVPARELALSEPTSPSEPRDVRSELAVDELEAAPSDRWVLRILEADSSPAAGIETLLLEESGETTELTTSADGTLERAPGHGTAVLFVKRRSALPHRAEIELAPGEHTRRLPAGEEVSGRVRERGGAPDRTLTLSLETPAAGLGFDVPEHVRAFLEVGSGGGSFTSCSTGPSGEFRFHGLPPSWSGSLVVPRPFVLAGPKSDGRLTRTLELASPARDLLIEIERLPCLVGRVVDVDGSPVAGAEVTALLYWSDGGSMGVGATFPGPPGRFEVGLRESFRRAEIAVAGPGGRNAKRYAFAREDLGPDSDHDLVVGDLQLAAGRTIAFRVLDSHGEPIEGARVEAEGGVPRAESGADGAGSLDGVPFDVDELCARAAGYWLEPRELAGGAEESVVFKMRRGNRLVLELRGPDGNLASSGLQIELASPGAHLFPDTRSPSPDPLLSSAAGRAVSSITYLAAGEVLSTWFTPRSGEPLELVNLAPGVPIRMRVLDRLSSELHLETIAPLGPSEERTHVVALAQNSRRLSGRVVDASDEPVVEANVVLEAGEDTSDAVETDASGAFRIEGLFVERADVVVSKEGHARAWLRGLPIPASGAEITMRLERGHDVRVTVADIGGRTIEAGSLVARAPDGRE